MSSDTIVRSLLQSANHSRAESLSTVRVVGIFRRSRRGQCLFDRLDHDIHRIECLSAIGTYSAILGSVILDELRSRRDLRGVGRRNGYMDLAPVIGDLLIE